VVEGVPFEGVLVGRTFFVFYFLFSLFSVGTHLLSSRECVRFLDQAVVVAASLHKLIWVQ